MGLVTNTYDVKTIVIKKFIEESEAMEMVEQKKTDPFKSLLSRPKKEDIHIDSLKLFYEGSLIISGKYNANYFRKAVHTIDVDSNVHEIVLGDGFFPVRSKSGLEKTFVGKRGKNKIDLSLEEHVFVEGEDELTFDHHGLEIELPFKIDSKNIENYPDKILEENQDNVKKPEFSYESAIENLKIHLKKPLEENVRDLKDEFMLHDIIEVYLPIFEARLSDVKKKVKILRIDAVRKKIL
ncbi:MAG: hypothetical protein OEW86_03150 [Nitrosopumilus sp.]|nr:hypothetical protein [Nitrosopumilus sp.]MDH3565483.1 hypothetical protein [Nitrosopumilus sp.]MDH5416970.1 hypothetical protein [Nitrosopumilus sp.]MDH5555379.1 hypothetical protein [Nitrosopumilus sp.]